MNNNKISLRDTFTISRRGFAILQKHFPGLLRTMILSSAASALTPYVGIWFSARILNELAGARRPEALRSLVLATLVSTALLGFLCHFLQTSLSQKWDLYYRKRHTIDSCKFFSMDYEDVDRAEVRELFRKIRGNENWNDWGFSRLLDFLENFTGGVVGILGAVVLTISLFTTPVPNGRFTFLNHPAFVLAVTGVLLFTVWFSSFCHNRATDCEASLAEEATFGNRLGMLADWFTNPKVALDVRMYNQQKIIRYYLDQDKTFSPGGVFARYTKGPIGLWHTLGTCMSAVLIGFVYVFVCLKAWAGAFGVGSITQYVGSVTALAKSLSALIESIGLLKSNAPFLKLYYEFLDIPNKMYQGSLTTEKRSDRQYDVEFRDVSFKYPGTDVWALRHVNMKFRVGSRLAVVGENGSGKSTFIKLLCRLYDPTEGEIRLNGIDIRKYKYEDYIDIFSVVFQDFHLISQPLGSNVAGCTNYDRERAINALKDSGFGERLESLPKGLDTMLYRDIDQDGVEISGGEAQKIAIARALYKDAPFIILDEPTAALDPIAEAEIYSKFNDISGDRTAIYISHRLSSCKFCDEIAVFDKGSVIQKGTHETLLADASGKYAQLWNAQAQYYVNQQAVPC